MLGTFVGELLGKWGALSEDWSLPVDDVDGEDEDEGDAEEDCGSICDMVFVALSADI
jgi:hypothetical protein